eukprot:TRINITY_DN34968_c0_g2_i3.p1 TRINITY_DN34968_c0_g2~~TRINITY_DN34968_c0_g2_i3.p1  ORF type:complete len:741 (-),score=78.69 TRINITY_DN34968_c0_g2_i3:136-2358(-)
MGCAACCGVKLDSVAPPHKPYRVPPGSELSGDGRSSSSTPPRKKPYHSEEAEDARTSGRNGPYWSAAAILAEGALLQGLQFAQWSEADKDVAANFGVGQQFDRPFGDGDGLLELSTRQKEALDRWQRMPAVIRNGSGLEPQVFASTITSASIKQGLVGDCSFLSALSALAEYETKFREPVLSSILYPRGKDDKGVDSPVYSEHGQYACKLFLNGIHRKVMVDDRVPVRSSGQLLCAHAASSNEMWVTLLEKSYAKIMGSSYDMQGSNPGTDVFHLTGWVPETIPLGGPVACKPHAADTIGQRSQASWDEVFRMAAQGYREGHCVVCVGTSEIHDAVPNAEARKLGHIEGVSTSTGLVARHAYPMVDCAQVGNVRLLRLKNPWGRVRWRGRFAPGDKSWEEALHQLKKNHSGSWPDGSPQLSKEAIDNSLSGGSDDGYFWIPWEEVLRYFSHLYLCWAPRAMGLTKLETHGRWDPHPHFTRSWLPDDTHVVAFNPQFLLKLDRPPPPQEGQHDDDVVAWVLLSRHVKDRADITNKYMAVHVYHGDSRLACPDAPLEQGVYSNGECALVKLRRHSANTRREFVLVVSQHATKAAFNFTLQVYTPSPWSLQQLPPLVSDDYISGSARGKWTAETSGGCSNNLWNYFKNPQWRLEVPDGEPAALQLFAECPAEFSINIRLFSDLVARPEELRKAVSSGAYRQGCCVLTAGELAPGPYIAVVSTFRPDLIGEYRLAWHSSRPLRW